MSSHSHRCDDHSTAGDAETTHCCSVSHEHPAIPVVPSEQLVDGDALAHDCLLCRLLAQFEVDIPTVESQSLEDFSVFERLSVTPVFVKEVHFRQSGRAPPMLSRFC